uniref:Uncharacterized protein n=1 Tax=Arundo donax TaxID=35708 RepID=A0A0A9CRT9_ARUDO
MVYKAGKNMWYPASELYTLTKSKVHS